MPRRGGEADKFGNRYEGLWTVDAVLDLIDEDYVALEVERVGEEAGGIEFVRTDHSGAEEYHSIKRQHARGNWTVSRLRGEEVLGHLFAKAMSGADAVFSSGTSATKFEELIQCATQFASFETFARRISDNAELSADFYDRIVPICSDDEGASYEALKRLKVRVKNEPELRRDVERRIRSTFRMESGTPLDPRAVRLLIGDLVLDRLGNPLTRRSYLDELAAGGVVPSRWAGDAVVEDSIRRRNRTYISGVHALHINRTEISRQEAVVALDALLEQNKSVMIEGAAGSGKSSVVAQVVEQVTKRDVPCLVVNLDSLNQETDTSAQALGTNRGLPDSPAISLGEFAGAQPCVLVIDQLDALSVVSARQQWAWEALYELLDEARKYTEMRVLFACRSFDLEQDARLRRLADDPERVERIRVEALAEGTIRNAIAASGISSTALTDEQLEILSTPLHLYLFLEASPSEAVNFGAPGDLFDAFWRRKARAVMGRLSGPQSLWESAIAAVCKELSDRESLVAPEHALDDQRLTLEMMASEGVLTVRDGEVRFFHESFFDYCFGRTFFATENDRDLVEWLSHDQQALFRRSQVRQVLAFLRRDSHDRRRYLRTLAGLLTDPRVRFHIKKLVLDWLRSLNDPTPEEWTSVEGAADGLGAPRWAAVRNSAPWFDVLFAMGRWDDWLGADQATADQAIHLLGMPDVLDTRGERVASLVQRHRDDSPEWRERSWMIAAVGHGYDSPKMQQLLLELIALGPNDGAVSERTKRIDLSVMLYRLSGETPSFGPVVIGSWLDREFDVATLSTGETGVADQTTITIDSHSIGLCAKSAPREFVRELFPRIVDRERKNPTQRLSEPSPSGVGVERLGEILIGAMIHEAQHDPKELDIVLEDHTFDESKWTEAAALRTWSANGSRYADRIVRFVLAKHERRLRFQYDISRGGSDSFAGITRTAIAAASPFCSPDLFEALERAVVFFTPDWERRDRRVGRTELALLRALPNNRIAESTRRRIQELERKFRDAREYGAPEPLREDIGLRTDSPIPERAHSLMTDDQWLAAMRRYPDDSTRVRKGAFIGSATELSYGLERETRRSPTRFAELAERMNGSYNRAYFRAIIRGLTIDEKGTSSGQAHGQTCLVLRRIAELGINLPSAEIASAAHIIAHGGLPDDIVQWLCQIALDDPDPEEDDWLEPDEATGPMTQAMNSARGLAAMAVSRLLFADRMHWQSLRPTIERLVTDPVLAVRSVAVSSLLAVIDHERKEAFALFERLADGADTIMGSCDVERFLHFAIFRDYSAIRPHLIGMLVSTSASAVRVAGRQLTVAALHLDSELARSDQNLAVNARGEARVGAAEIYVANLADPTVGTACQAHLRDLFDDDNEAVRAAAREWWRSLSANDLASSQSLLADYAQSRAFEEHNTSVILHRLREATAPLPIELCGLADRAVAQFGPKASSIQYAEAGVARGLSELMIRLHEQTNPEQRSRVLDSIDGMLRADFHGLQENLELHATR